MFFVSPTLASPTHYFFPIGSLSNIDWETYVTVNDNYTKDDEIIIEVLSNNIKYFKSGLYTVKIQLTDLVDNSSIYFIYVQIN